MFNICYIYQQIIQQSNPPTIYFQKQNKNNATNIMINQPQPSKQSTHLTAFKIPNNRSTISRVSSEPEPLQNTLKYINLLFINKAFQSSAPFKKLFVIYLVIGIVMVIVGVVFLVIAGINIGKQEFLYVQIPYFVRNNLTVCRIGRVCRFGFQVTEEMFGLYSDETVFVSYEVDGQLEKWEANGYINSFSRRQLAGISITDHQLTNQCRSDYLLNSQINKTTSISGSALDPNKIANPCGLIASNFNNDSFRLFRNQEESENVTEIPIMNDLMLWQGYLGSEYQQSENSGEEQWISHKQYHFVAWMAARGLPRTKIFWGYLLTNSLLPGNYTLQATLHYNSSLWTGNRYFYIQSQQNFNGKYLLFPIMLVSIGILGMMASKSLWNISQRIKDDSKYI